jgi:hypothetical protein
MEAHPPARCFDRRLGVWRCGCCCSFCCCMTERPKESFSERSLWCPILMDAVSDSFYSWLLALLCIVRLALGHTLPSLLGADRFEKFYTVICPPDAVSLLFPGCHAAEGSGTFSLSQVVPFILLASNTMWNHRIWIWIGLALAICCTYISLRLVVNHELGFTAKLFASAAALDIIISTLICSIALESCGLVPSAWRQNVWDAIAQKTTQTMMHYSVLPRTSDQDLPTSINNDTTLIDEVGSDQTRLDTSSPVVGSKSTPLLSVAGSAGSDTLHGSDGFGEDSARVALHLKLQRALSRKNVFDNDAAGTSRFYSARVLSASIFGMVASMAIMVAFRNKSLDALPLMQSALSGICDWLAANGFAPDIAATSADRQADLANFFSVFTAASYVAIFVSVACTGFGQVLLLRGFRRDVLRLVYWHERTTFPELVVAVPDVGVSSRNIQSVASSSHSDPKWQIRNPLEGRSVSLASAPLFFGYAVTNAVFLALLVFASYICLHLAFGCGIIRRLLYDLLIPRGSALVELIGELLLILLRILLFSLVHIIEGSGARITQYRWFCYFDCLYFLVGYNVGMFMISVRILVSVVHKIFSIFRIDRSQFPDIAGASNFDPLHNAYLASVLLEAQLQEAHRCALVEADASDSASGDAGSGGSAATACASVSE